MDKYKKGYSYLAGQIDEALSLMDTGNLMEYEHVRKILQNALLEAENYMISDEK